MTNIRPFDKEKDYPAAIAITNIIWSDSSVTEERWRHYDDTYPSRLQGGRFVAEKAGEVVGTILFGQSENPQKFWIWMVVHPSHQRQGVGTSLYHTVLEVIAPHNPIEVSTSSREDEVFRMAFLEKLGFVETWRDWESRLNVANFDSSVLQGAADRVAASGITIHTYTELIDDPERDQKLYELDCFIGKDIPYTEPHVPISFEEYKKQNIEDNLHFLPDASFIAIDNRGSKSGKYVGISTLGKPSADNYLNTGLTGVLREYRGRGIASALKLRAALYAKERNIPEVRTGNAQVNKEMLAINEKMGFVKQPAWISFKKEI
jgi:mycothiol synthase